jgi:1,4-alpha-glucan branching enzyme
MVMRITQAIREHLKFLELNGRLTPERVVHDAKRPESPLHEHFLWDVQKAAEHFWLDQARDLIRAVKVVVVINEVTVKAPYYVPDPSKNGREQGYTTLDALRDDPVSAKQSLIAECERAAGVLRRARLIALALNLEGQIDTVLAHVAGLKSQLSGGADNHTTQ